MMELAIILTGATGMVGEGVLLELLRDERVGKVLIINRSHCGIAHPKLKEIIHKDFFDLSPVKQELVGYNACFFCLGVSSIGKKEPEYFRMTYTLTMHMAEILAAQNPGMVFCYISGTGTDSSERGRIMWARVKGKTENDLAKLPFAHTYAVRPGFLKATPGQKHVLPLYKYLFWLYPIVKMIFPHRACSLAELGRAMINAACKGYEKRVLEVKDIMKLAKG